MAHTYNLLQMMKVMGFRWWKKWHMVPWMIIEGDQDWHCQPQP